MNILFYYADYGTAMYEWCRVHIIDELEHHDCKVKTLNPVEYSSLDEANDALKKEISKKKYDLFITPHNENILYIDSLNQIKKNGIPTLLMCCDNLVVPFVHFKIAPLFDLVWLTSIETQYMFDKIGCNSIFLPYAANPLLKRSEEAVAGIGFVGTPYGSRANTINRLTAAGIPVYCHSKKNGTGKEIRPLNKDTMTKGKIIRSFMSFPQGRKIIQGAIANKLHKESKIIENAFFHLQLSVNPSDLYMMYPKYSLALSSTAARNTGVLKKPLNIINLRAFEIPMSGGVQFCQYSDEIASYFEDGKEIILFNNFDDMVDKARYYLKPENKPIRDSIRKAARYKAENNHTWWHRFVKVFDQLGIPYRY